MNFMGILVSFQITKLFWKSRFIPSSPSKSRPIITSWLLFLASYMKWWKTMNRKINSGSLVLTSAMHDVKKDPAIVDHLFAEVFLVLSLFVRMDESKMINTRILLSIRIFTYLELLRKSFCKTLIFLESFLRIINWPKVMGTKSICLKDIKLL